MFKKGQMNMQRNENKLEKILWDLDNIALIFAQSNFVESPI